MGLIDLFYPSAKLSASQTFFVFGETILVMSLLIRAFIMSGLALASCSVVHAGNCWGQGRWLPNGYQFRRPVLCVQNRLIPQYCGAPLRPANLAAAPPVFVVPSEPLEPITETIQYKVAKKVPETVIENGVPVTRYRTVYELRTRTRVLSTANAQINYLKRELARVENNKVDPLEGRVQKIENSK